MQTPRVQWMQQMVSDCFNNKSDDSGPHLIDKEMTQKFIDYLSGKMGKTLIIYYQKPTKPGEKNSDSETPQFLINEETKNVQLQNRACFFVRSLADGKEVNLQTQSDDTVMFGEISPDSIVGMNKVIYNYLSPALETVDWGNNINEDQKKEFKKVMGSFAKDINDTVDSLVSGVKFQELPDNVREFIQKDKKDFTTEEERQVLTGKIEEIYQNWIDVLTKEIEDMDKENPAFSDSGPKSELERWKYRMQRLTKVNDFFKSSDYRLVSKYFIEQKNKLSTKVQTLNNEMKQKKIDAHTAHSEARDNVKYLSTLEIYFDPLYNGTPDTIIDSLQSLMNSLKLISFTARYYDNTKMTNLFSKITSQMITNCIDYILDNMVNREKKDPTYLWDQKPQDLIQKFQKCIELYKSYKEKYKQAKTNTTSSNKENNFEFGENQLFGKFEQFCKRLTKLIIFYLFLFIFFTFLVFKILLIYISYL